MTGLRLQRLAAGGLAGLLMLATLGTAPARATTTDEIISRGKLTVAIDTTTAPYGMVDESMQPSGFDIDVANAHRQVARRASRVRHGHLAGAHSVAAHQPRRHGNLDLLDHRRARAAGRLQHPLCRAVLGGAGAEERCHQGTGGPRRASRSASPAAPARTASSRRRPRTTPASRSCASTTMPRSARRCSRADRRDGRRRLRRHVPQEERQGRGLRAEVHR